MELEEEIVVVHNGLIVIVVAGAVVRVWMGGSGIHYSLKN